VAEDWTVSVCRKIDGLLKTNKNAAKEKLTSLLIDYRQWQQNAIRKSNQRTLQAIVTQTDSLMTSLNKLTTWDKEDLNTLMRLTITKEDIVEYDKPTIHNPLFQLFNTARNFSDDEQGIPKKVRVMLTAKWIEPTGDCDGPQALTDIFAQKLRRLNRSASALINPFPRKGQARKGDRALCIAVLWAIFLRHAGQFDTGAQLRKAFRAFVLTLNRDLPEDIALGTEGSIKKALEKMHKSGDLEIPKRK
jgi:hypothetical protein